MGNIENGEYREKLNDYYASLLTINKISKTIPHDKLNCLSSFYFAISIVNNNVGCHQLLYISINSLYIQGVPKKRKTF